MLKYKEIDSCDTLYVYSKEGELSYKKTHERKHTYMHEI